MYPSCTWFYMGVVCVLLIGDSGGNMSVEMEGFAYAFVYSSLLLCLDTADTYS